MAQVPWVAGDHYRFCHYRCQHNRRVDNVVRSTTTAELTGRLRQCSREIDHPQIPGAKEGGKSCLSTAITPHLGQRARWDNYLRARGLATAGPALSSVTFPARKQ